jgi:hypothetical protein
MTRFRYRKQRSVHFGFGRGQRLLSFLDSISCYSNISVYSNDRRIIEPFPQMVLPQAEKFAVQQGPTSEAVGTGVSYLSAEPCPVKAWVDTKPNSDVPLFSGIADSGGPSIIRRDLVPKQYEILAHHVIPSSKRSKATQWTYKAT